MVILPSASNALAQIKRCEKVGSGICFLHQQKVIVTHQNYYIIMCWLFRPVSPVYLHLPIAVKVSALVSLCIVHFHFHYLSVLWPFFFVTWPWRLWLWLRIEVVLHTNVCWTKGLVGSLSLCPLITLQQQNTCELRLGRQQTGAVRGDLNTPENGTV